MKWQDLIAETYRTLSEEYENTLDGLTIDDLHKRPAPDANTIGWLLWHTARSYDRTVGDVMSGEQLWIKEKWYKKFKRNPNLNDTGYRHSPEEVGDLYIPDVETLRDYQRAVIKTSVEYIEKLTEEELDRDCPLSTHPGTTATAGMRIIGNINDCYQHVGQAAYVRCLIIEQGWLG